MIDIDVERVYIDAHGSDNKLERFDPCALIDTTDTDAVRNVCRKLLELMQAFSNLKAAIAECGDCVRLSFGDMGSPMALAAVAAALMDGGQRDVYLRPRNADVLEMRCAISLRAAQDMSGYTRRWNRRLRRPS